MIPKVAKRGNSFRNAANYYFHDKEASTKERIEWTQTRNLLTDDPDKAWKVMAWTAKHNEDLKRASGARLTGQKLKNPVFSFSLSWHPEQQPEKKEMIRSADEAISFLGLTEHEAILVAHSDEEHRHVHVIANIVHPETGLVQDIKFDRRKFSEWALNYEKENGKIYCPQRAENKQRRKIEMSKPKEQRRDVRYKDPVIQSAWERSDSGKSFSAALNESGYQIANGNNRLVVVDRWGKAHNPVRLLEGVKTKDFNARMADLDRDKLPQSTELQASIEKQNRADYRASRKHDKWAAELRVNTQNRQLEQWGNLKTKYHDEIERKREELTKYYKTEEVKKEIARLKKELTKKPSLWNRVTRKTATNTQKLEALESQLSDIQQRMDEQIGRIEVTRDRALEEQKHSHEDEEQRVRELIERRRPERYQSEQERDAKRKKRNQKSRDSSLGRTRDIRPGGR